jgi:hypothetical protein
MAHWESGSSSFIYRVDKFKDFLDRSSLGMTPFWNEIILRLTYYMFSEDYL